MVEFQEDNNPKTSGNGLFLDTLDINMKVDSSLIRCNQFILDSHHIIFNILILKLKLYQTTIMIFQMVILTFKVK